MNPPNSSACYSYDPFKCYCPHTLDQHALTRCGHPNERPPSHPLHTADDALHGVWCFECGQWCFSERDDCPIFKESGVKLGCGKDHRKDGDGGDDKPPGARPRKRLNARM